jgi:hypothetical protein
MLTIFVESGLIFQAQKRTGQAKEQSRFGRAFFRFGDKSPAMGFKVIKNFASVALTASLR